MWKRQKKFFNLWIKRMFNNIHYFMIFSPSFSLFCFILLVLRLNTRDYSQNRLLMARMNFFNCQCWVSKLKRINWISKYQDSKFIKNLQNYFLKKIDAFYIFVSLFISTVFWTQRFHNGHNRGWKISELRLHWWDFEAVCFSFGKRLNFFLCC